MIDLDHMSESDVSDGDMSESAKLIQNEQTEGDDGLLASKPNKYGSDEDKKSKIQDTDLSQNQAQIQSSDQKSEPVIVVTQSTSYIFLLTFFSAIGGFLFGYDTGVVSGAMLQVGQNFNLSTIWVEAIVSVTIGAAAISALCAGFLNDITGRKPVIIFASAVFTIGALVLAVAQDKWMLLIGRCILGIGIGFASMTVPMYIAESAPSHLRGRLVTLNNLFITGGQFIASVIDGAFSYNTKNGWRFMFGLAAVPSLIQFFGFFFMPESPRWLIGKGREEQATMVLQKIRGVTDVSNEINEIRTVCMEDKIAQQHQGNKPAIIQALCTPHVRKAIIIGCMLQVFQQISGINTVMYYSATIIKMSGVKDVSTAIWLASLTAFINFAFTLVGLYLVDKIGRRKLTLGSLLGTTLSLALLGVAFQMMAKQSPYVTFDEKHNKTSDSCAHYSVCDTCIQDADCGFCYIEGDKHTAQNGSCVAIPEGNKMNKADYGRCSTKPMTDHAVWAYDYCPTNIAWLATVGLMLYLAFFAPGMGPMPWTINSEIYPLWARSSGNSLSTFCNWTFNLLISMTFLTLTDVLTKYGAFYLYTSFAFLGLIFVFFFVPETKGRNLEQVEELFKKPWCALRKS